MSRSLVFLLLFPSRSLGFSSRSGSNSNLKISILLENFLVSQHFGFVNDSFKPSYVSCCGLLQENTDVRVHTFSRRTKVRKKCTSWTLAILFLDCKVLIWNHNVISNSLSSKVLLLSKVSSSDFKKAISASRTILDLPFATPCMEMNAF